MLTFEGLLCAKHGFWHFTRINYQNNYDRHLPTLVGGDTETDRMSNMPQSYV